MTHLNIQINKSKYPLFIGVDNLHKIGELFHLYKFGSRVALIIDSNLKGNYTKRLVDSFLKNKISVSEIFISGGERNKNLNTIHQICRSINEQDIELPETILAFGGGVTADIAGFVANIFNDEIKYVQIPSSLIAQIESSISESAFLNVESKTNIISIPYKLHLVWCDIGLLRTLPTRELFSGLAYILRYSIVGNTDFFDFLEQHFDEIEDMDLDVLEEVVRRCCEVKMSLLNSRADSLIFQGLKFGTLIATALEEATNFSLFTPGEALIRGMLVESLSALRAGIFNNSDFEKFFNLLSRIKMALKVPEIDKKSLENRIKFKLKTQKLVLPFRIGEFSITKQFDENILFDSLKILKIKD